MPKKVATIEMVFSIDGIGTVLALPKEDEWSLDPKETRSVLWLGLSSPGCYPTLGL